MNNTTKNILIAVATVLVAGALIGGMIWCTHLPKGRTCQHLIIQISDANQRNYVSENEIQNLLKNFALYPVGQNTQDIKTQAIENAVAQHPMVRTAECFATNTADIQIVITQRIPLLRVITATESYFVDTDRKRMPLNPNVKDQLIIVSGHIGERMAREDLYDMVQWINDNHFWAPRISKIEVREGKQILLHQNNNEPTILLGNINDYPTKLKKLRIFIEKSTEDMGIPKYKVLDIRYKNQVVGRN